MSYTCYNIVCTHRMCTKLYVLRLGSQSLKYWLETSLFQCCIVIVMAKYIYFRNRHLIHSFKASVIWQCAKRIMLYGMLIEFYARNKIEVLLLRITSYFCISDSVVYTVDSTSVVLKDYLWNSTAVLLVLLY